MQKCTGRSNKNLVNGNNGSVSSMWHQIARVVNKAKLILIGRLYQPTWSYKKFPDRAPSCSFHRVFQQLAVLFRFLVLLAMRAICRLKKRVNNGLQLAFWCHAVTRTGIGNSSECTLCSLWYVGFTAYLLRGTPDYFAPVHTSTQKRYAQPSACMMCWSTQKLTKFENIVKARDTSFGGLQYSPVKYFSCTCHWFCYFPSSFVVYVVVCLCCCLCCCCHRLDINV